MGLVATGGGKDEKDGKAGKDGGFNNLSYSAAPFPFPLSPFPFPFSLFFFPLLLPFPPPPKKNQNT